MVKARILNIVGTDCPKNEEQFNKWYNAVHIPLLFKYPGLKKVTRYQLMPGSQAQAKYIAIYEYDDKATMDAFPKSPEFKAAIDEMNRTWKDNMFEIKWAANYEPIKTWEK
jgi:uncharacterized protein (TIGR02118 family)